MIPDTIYLQWFDEDGEKDGEVTWCDDRINETDLVYHFVSEPLRIVIRCEACGMFGTPAIGSVCGNCGSTDTDIFVRIPSGPVGEEQDSR